MANEAGPTATLTKGTRERILEAAMKIVVEQGVGGLRIRDLARKAGIREGSIYNHFDSRDSIVGELFKTMEAKMSPLGEVFNLKTATEETVGSLESELRAKGLASFLQGAKAALIEGFSRDPASLEAFRAVLSSRFNDSAAKRAYDELLYPDISGIFGSIFLIAGRMGLLRSGTEPSILAELVAATIEHAVTRCYADSDLARLDALLGSMMEAIARLAAAPSPNP
jgi:AcrR family transcriptional regulator